MAAAAVQGGQGAVVDTRRDGHRIPALDGLRGLAVAAVVGLHLDVSWLSGGGRGVDVFFVLSGFLITSILVRDPDGPARGVLRRFYERRARRILPALLLVLAYYVAFAAFQELTSRQVFRDSPIPDLRTSARQAAYAASFGAFTIGEPVMADLGGMFHVWSLAVEEQFYLVVPLLFLPLLRRGRSRELVVLLLLVVLVVQLQRLRLVDGVHGAYRVLYYPDTRADAIAVGCLAALAAPRLLAPGQVSRRSLDVAAMAAAVVLGALVTLSSDQDVGFLASAGFLMASLASAVLVLHAVADGQHPLLRLLSAAPLCWLGRRSYAVYLWHVPLIWTVGPTLGPHRLPLLIVLTLLAAELSWRLVEHPALRGGPSRERLAA